MAVSDYTPIYMAGFDQITASQDLTEFLNQTKRTVKPNLQKVTILVDGKPKKVWASARALKSGKVERV